MRSPYIEDRTSKAIIRDEALRLFATRNADAVTVRDIAAASGVSPSLILRHYGSKDGLRAAVGEHVVRLFQTMLEQATAPEGTAPLDVQALPSLATQVARNLPTGSPIPAYLARLLIDGGPEARALFAQLHALSQAGLADLIEAGSAIDGGDPSARAAFLLANDLAVIMLRDRLHEVLGMDPLSVAGLHRWGRQVLAVYQGGLLATPSDQR
ncbi:AcrR family transcriptional regulator [Nakamurella sp. UYEF19]|uniref:TetR/AcrR family transcriptional regulator n=1 Tax=Nakamurella sp. UYEF19 TaxID=1756392 RepID=UPI0033956390